MMLDKAAASESNPRLDASQSNPIPTAVLVKQSSKSCVAKV
jgi:hypothetical protein